jgi:nicotinamidase-related amidase
MALDNKQPRTLRDLAGASATPPKLADSTLVLIDAQQEYVTGRLPLAGVEAALREAGALLAAARAAGATVVHVQHKGRAGGLFDPDGPYFAINEAVAPRPGESLVHKGLPNAFAGTDLEALLKAGGARSLVFAGFMTHMCISSSVRAALDLGYASTVVAGACATRDLPDGQGGVVTAASLHRAEMAALADRFALIVESAAAFTA